MGHEGIPVQSPSAGIRSLPSVVVGIAVAYAVAAKVSFLATIPPGNISPIFPSTGIGLAAALIWGRPALLAVWLGSFSANAISFLDGTVTTDRGIETALPVSMLLGLGATSSAAAGRFLVCRLCRGRDPLESGMGVLVLGLVGAMACCAISPTIGVSSLAAGGYVPWDRFGYSWATWWLGDTSGAIVVAPLILAWHRSHPARQDSWRIPEAIALGGVTLALSIFVFFANHPFVYCLLPMLLWAAFRFGMRGASTVAAVVALFATICTCLGTSPFVRGTVAESLLLLHSFMGVSTICTLVLAGVLAERRRAEAALRENERKYQELVENANSIILHWSRDGRIIFLNEYGQRFFGYTEAEIRGRHVVGTIVPESETGGRDLQRLMEQICADPAAFEQNVNENVRRNGERVWIAWTNKVEMDSQGKVSEILSIGTDITALKRAEEDLRAAHATLERRVAERTAELAEARDRAEAADRIKSAFLATMSHELRTPLNSIIGFTGLLLQGLAGPLNEEQTKQLRMVKDSGQHLLALINDVLDISKIEAGQVEIRCEPFDLPASIRKVVQAVTPLSDKKRLPLVVQVAPEVTLVDSDRRRVEQILLNLLSNAIKFTERGRIDLTAERVPNGVRISVTDTGMGIKPEDIDKLFHPFRQLDTGLTRQHVGTGLGLAICKRLVDRLGGTMVVDSAWGKGSTFRFTIPVQPAGET